MNTKTHSKLPSNSFNLQQLFGMEEIEVCWSDKLDIWSGQSGKSIIIKLKPVRVDLSSGTTYQKSPSQTE